MKKAALFFYFFSVSFMLHAQDKLPSFGHIDKADLEMNDCDFDPGAEAMVMLDVAEIDFSYEQNAGWVSETNYRMRIKVFKKSAVDRGQIKMSYYAKNQIETIFSISGISYNLDENGQTEESKLENKNIYDKPINKDFSEVSFAMPNVKTGTVFEYRYKIRRKSYSYIPSWNFQEDIPVKYSAYTRVFSIYLIGN
jgi:hypothetical protein